MLSRAAQIVETADEVTEARAKAQAVLDHFFTPTAPVRIVRHPFSMVTGLTVADASQVTPREFFDEVTKPTGWQRAEEALEASLIAERRS